MNILYGTIKTTSAESLEVKGAIKIPPKDEPYESGNDRDHLGIGGNSIFYEILNSSEQLTDLSDSLFC